MLKLITILIVRLILTIVGQVGRRLASTTYPIKLTTEIDGKPLVIEAADITQADAALQLALKYRVLYPTTADQVSPKSTIKVQGQMPARKRRRRR